MPEQALKARLIFSTLVLVLLRGTTKSLGLQ
jgi:hypothetical protein